MRKILALTAVTLTAIGGMAAQADAAVVFSQDFSSSTTLEDYIDVNSDPGSGNFNDITANPTSTAAISNGALVLTDGSGNYGLYRDGLNAANTGMMTVTLMFSVSNATNQPLFRFQVGNYGSYSSVTDYSNQLSNVRFDDMLGRGASSSFRLETAGGNISNLAWDDSHTMIYLLNNSGSEQTYTGPDSVQRTLGDGSMTIFMDGVLAIDNAARASGSGDLSTFRIYNTWSNNSALAIDSIVIEDSLVPEPTSMALIGLGSLLLLKRQRR